MQELSPKIVFPELDLDLLFNFGIIADRGRSDSSYFTVPGAYAPYLPPVLQVQQWDRPVTGVVVDAEGICYLVLLNTERNESKRRKNEFDGMQLLVDAFWKEGRADMFEFPKFCVVDFLSFKVIAAPLERWLQTEAGYAPFLTSSVWKNAPQMAQWEKVNAQAAEALADLSKHIPGCGKYPLPRADEGDAFRLLIAVSKQKMALSCPVGLALDPSEPNPAALIAILEAMTRIENPVSSPLVLRSLLKTHGFRVRHLGRILLGLEFPILKEIVAREMLGRSAKWHIRKLIGDSFQENNCLPVLSAEKVDLLLADSNLERFLVQEASEYFSVPFAELSPYVTPIPSYFAKFVKSDFSSVENRTLFPHANLLEKSPISGGCFFPSLKFVSPRPSPIQVSASSPLDALPLHYAAKLFELELMMASGNILRAVVTIGDLVDVILQMREIEPVFSHKEQMRRKVLALCEAGRGMIHQELLVPPLITHAVLECAPSFEVFTQLRAEINESSDTQLALLALDSLMAKHLFEKDPGKAVDLLAGVAERSEKWLGASHPVTIASWVRKGQTIKQMVDMRHDATHADFPKLLQNGIRCLNKAINAAVKDHSALSPIDQKSLSYHLLGIFHMWNGEPGKAVSVTRQGLEHLELTTFGVLHPRYINSAFLHAKMLELFAASSTDTAQALQAAREAVDLLERLLDSLQDLTSSCDSDADVVKELVTLFGEEFLDTDLDMKRKLAVTALILKLNVWLLDPSVSADLLDLVVADQLSGAKGVLVLPNRLAVKEVVTKSLKAKIEQLKSKSHSSLPVLEFSSTLPEPVMKCCKMALLAKSRGTSVTDWFRFFRDETVRTIGETENLISVQNKQLLTTLFLSFVYVTTADDVYVGPLAYPLVARDSVFMKESRSLGIIYRDWERSATLYSIDHDINPLLKDN